MMRSKIAVGFATAGRPAILAATMRELSKQTLLPDCVFVCPASEKDFDLALVADLPFQLVVVKGPIGLTAQRNAILDRALEFDILVFLDDDFFPSPSYLKEMALCFASDPAIVLAHGHVLADGSAGQGLDEAVARSILQQSAIRIDQPLMDDDWAWGCNMALRLASVYDHNMRFDENLPLYGFLEDQDFSCRMTSCGRVVKNNLASGAHLGVKTGRTSELRYGYSQVANPIYLWRKGTSPLHATVHHSLFRVISNLVKLWQGDPWIDRRGRALGHALAYVDMVRGRLHPARMLELD